MSICKPAGLIGLGIISAVTAVACGEDMGPVSDGTIGFSNLTIADIDQNRAVMSGNTSLPATCAVRYGLTMDNLEWEATDPDMPDGEFWVDHNVPLEDLMPGTTYYLRAVAEGEYGEYGESEVVSFATRPDPGTDPTADMVSVATLAQGASVVEVSSNYSNGDNDSGFGVHNALDDMEATQWSTNGDGDDAWVRLDLGQLRQITAFAYRSRMMSDGTSIVTSVRVIVEDQGDLVLGPFQTPEHDTRYVFVLPEPISTQFVRFEAVDTTGGNTGARVIQFYEPKP